MSKFSDMGSNMNMIGMKRSREEYSDQFDSITAMANCLMILSGVGGDQFQLLSNAANHHHHRQYRDVSPSRVFECKTCNRQFSSFQALGGHRASHKKPKLGGDLSLQSEASPVKPKTHECSICGQEFAVGQALGGHMRRHRAALSESPAVAAVISESSTNSEKRIWGLDLNLAPLENDDLDFGLGCKMASPPLVLDCVS